VKEAGEKGGGGGGGGGGFKKPTDWKKPKKKKKKTPKGLPQREKEKERRPSGTAGAPPFEKKPETRDSKKKKNAGDEKQYIWMGKEKTTNQTIKTPAPQQSGPYATKKDGQRKNNGVGEGEKKKKKKRESWHGGSQKCQQATKRARPGIGSP